MATVTFKRGTKAEIESTQIQDGQLLMETDQLNNNKIYLDLPNGTRVPVGGSGAWVGTKEEFELAVEEGKIADGTQVIITDDYESGITASMTLYSNAQSGLVATNVQGAIDELNSNLNSKITKEYVDNLIIPISIPNNNKRTYSIGLNGALFILPRNGVIFMSTYQSNKQTIVFGSIPSGLTISKDTDSYLITVENKMGYTLNGSIITT